jgi:L-rhamnose-H+ transport protein
MYGLGCGMVGIAIGSAIIGCTSIMAGTLGPLLVYAPAKLFSSASLILFAATVLIVAGIYMYGKAGAIKEREAGGSQTQVVKGAFRTGLVICLVCGVLGTAFVYGGKSSAALLASAKALGAPPLLAFYAAFVVTFNVGAIPGILFAIYKLRKNRTTGNFSERDVFWWNIGIAASMGLLWYSALLLYGMASEEMGNLGPSLAFALFSSGTVLFANLFGWLAGEWKGASRATIRGFLLGMTCIVGAIFLIAFGIHT